MTQSDPADRVTIVPTTAPLTQGGQRNRALSLPSARTLSFAVVVLLLAGVLAWVVIALPQNVEAPEAAIADAPPSDAAAPVRSAEPGIPPFRQLELERAEAEAREALGHFVELQRALEEDMNVEAWGGPALAAVLDRATEADRLFLEGDYEQALVEYAGALADLEAVRDRGETLYRDAIARGRTALDERRPGHAAGAFEDALAIHPDSVEGRTGKTRAERQPEVLDLLREAERARLRGAPRKALAFLEQARSLDRLTAGIDTALAEVRAEIVREAHRQRLSRGFTALEQGDFDAAETVFRDILAERSDDAAAQAGLAQTERERTIARINRLHEEAREREDAGDWEAALAAFEQVLKIDANLQFARDGRMRLRRRAQAVQEMQHYLADPAALSEDAVFAQARALLERAQADTDARGAYRGTVEEFAALLSLAEVPVELVLVSDNATEVTVYRVGRLGSFERRALQLRPGRYTIVGSRAGCRDVRKEIVLDAGMAPVTIRCEERI
ncbi:MAG: hypothetical protein F4X36_21105 [Gammaproteobacteria bacterium]|nr:hypothetical protein [Gammaproteobacteria bacterium]